jgi:hypothetical protein
MDGGADSLGRRDARDYAVRILIGATPIATHISADAPR